MANAWKWLLKNGVIVIKAGELLIEVGRAVRDSIRPAKPKAKD